MRREEQNGYLCRANRLDDCRTVNGAWGNVAWRNPTRDATTLKPVHQRLHPYLVRPRVADEDKFALFRGATGSIRVLHCGLHAGLVSSFRSERILSRYKK